MVISTLWTSFIVASLESLVNSPTLLFCKLQWLQDDTSVSKLAKLLRIHHNTLHDYLKRYNIDYQHTLISNSNLDLLVQHFCTIKPQSGLWYLSGSMNHHGLQIQWQCIAESLRRVDPLGRALQQHTTICHPQYKVSHQNALWHIDGHHKLIHWGIIIHGIIDGYCQTVSIILIHTFLLSMQSRLLH